jgi:hypothetical protein
MDGVPRTDAMIVGLRTRAVRAIGRMACGRQSIVRWSVVWHRGSGAAAEPHAREMMSDMRVRRSARAAAFTVHLKTCDVVCIASAGQKGHGSRWVVPPYLRPVQ